MKRYRLNSKREEDDIYDTIILSMNDHKRGFLIGPKLLGSNSSFNMRSIYTYTDRDIIGIDQLVPNKIRIEYLFSGYTNEDKIRPYLKDINVYTNGVLNTDDSILNEKTRIINKINEEVSNEDYTVYRIGVDLMDFFHINTTPYVLDLYQISLLKQPPLKPISKNAYISPSDIVLSIEKEK